MSPIIDAHQSEDQPVTLADHAEFLISPKRILCRKMVRLPRLCLHHGQSDNLVERSQTFVSMTVPLAVLTTIVVTGMVLLLHRTVGVAAVALVPVAIALFILLLPRLPVQQFPGVIAVQADWFVNANYARQCWWRTWLTRVGFVLIPIVLTLTGTHRFLVEFLGIDSSTVASTMIVAGALGSLLIRAERRLKYTGKVRRGPHAGLYSVTGHSEAFMDAVERLIHNRP